MTPQDKGKLLRAIRILVEQPDQISGETVKDALIGFRDLISEMTGGSIEIAYIQKE